MTTLVERVRRALDSNCQIKRGVKKDGCKIPMQNIPNPHLIIDFDKPGSPLAQDMTRCDFLVITNSHQNFDWVVPIELKRGGLSADQVAKQLQAGASAAEKLISKDESAKLRPVAASGNVSRHELNRLRNKRNMIRFHGRAEPIRLMSCGAPLSKVLDS